MAMFQAAQQQSEGAEVMEPGGVETLAGRQREIWKDGECGAGRFGRWRVEAEWAAAGWNSGREIYLGFLTRGAHFL
jgi:hypothetical protein